jgi:transcriptional regulator with XRE-family HTH domain
MQIVCQGNRGYRERMDAVILQERFAKRIREAMDAEGVNQTQLAKRMHVTPAAISQYLSGTIKSPGLDVVEKFAKALNVHDPAALLSDEKICLVIT